MRIIDGSDRSLGWVLLMFTRNEALEMIASLQSALDAGIGNDFCTFDEHTPQGGTTREVRVALYDPGDVSMYSEQIQRLLLQDDLQDQ